MRNFQTATFDLHTTPGTFGLEDPDLPDGLNTRILTGRDDPSKFDPGTLFLREHDDGWNERLGEREYSYYVQRWDGERAVTEAGPFGTLDGAASAWVGLRKDRSSGKMEN